MIPAESTLVSQGLLRVVALGFPLAVVLGVRQFGSLDFEGYFFVLLTDVTLLVALTKLGVDVYLPGCEQREGMVSVSPGYRRAYSSIVVCLLGATVLLVSVDGYWPLPSACALVLCALAFAEAGRLFGRFAHFYLFKAPATYVGTLLMAAVAFDAGWPGALIVVAGITLFALKVNSLFHSGEADIDRHSLATGSIVSLFIVFFGWKEAAVSRYFFDGDSLAQLVTYSRMALLITFPFMLRNARVPLVMRRHDDPRGASAITEAVRAGRAVNILWALIAAGLVTIVAAILEPTVVVGVALLMCSTCVLVAFGNVGACLVFLRDYKALAGAHLAAFGVFAGVLALLSFSGLGDVFLTVASASLAAQLMLGWYSSRAVSIWCRRSTGRAEKASDIVCGEV